MEQLLTQLSRAIEGAPMVALGAAFVWGILITLAAVGVLTAAAGRMMGDVGCYGNYFVALIFFVVGLHLLGVIPMPWTGPGQVGMKRKGLLAAFILGLVFGIALGPCTFAYMAPILGVTFRLAASDLLFGEEVAPRQPPRRHSDEPEGHLRVQTGGGDGREIEREPAEALFRSASRGKKAVPPRTFRLWRGAPSVHRRLLQRLQTGRPPWPCSEEHDRVEVSPQPATGRPISLGIGGKSPIVVALEEGSIEPTSLTQKGSAG